MTIEAEHYRDEVDALAADPILVTMSMSIPRGIDLESWSFTCAVGNEYKRQGGTRQKTIGGPARAIRLLLWERWED